MMSPVSNAPLPFCTGWPMQHRAALELSAAIDQCQTIPQRKRCSFPKSDARTLAHHPLAIGSVQKYLRIESLRPIHHRRVIMRMRDRDGADTAARVELGSGLAVEKRDAIPEQISSVRLQEQSALA